MAQKILIILSFISFDILLIKTIKNRCNFEKHSVDGFRCQTYLIINKLLKPLIELIFHSEYEIRNAFKFQLDNGFINSNYTRSCCRRSRSG